MNPAILNISEQIELEVLRTDVSYNSLEYGKSIDVIVVPTKVQADTIIMNKY